MIDELRRRGAGTQWRRQSQCSRLTLLRADASHRASPRRQRTDGTGCTTHDREIWVFTRTLNNNIPYILHIAARSRYALHAGLDYRVFVS